MKFNRFIMFLLAIASNLYASECIDQRTYLSKVTGKTIAIRAMAPNGKPVLIRYLPNGSVDVTFGVNGMVDIPTRTRVTKLILRYNPETDSAFVLDQDTPDMVVFDKNGTIKYKKRGKILKSIEINGEEVIAASDEDDSNLIGESIPFREFRAGHLSILGHLFRDRDRINEARARLQAAAGDNIPAAPNIPSAIPLVRQDAIFGPNFLAEQARRREEAPTPVLDPSE